MTPLNQARKESPMKSPSSKKVLDIHWPITIVSVAILLFMVGFLALRPDLTVGAINRILMPL